MKRLLFIMLLLFIRCDSNIPVIEPETGSLELHIISDFEPIEIIITGITESMFFGCDMIMYADSQDAKDANYIWYLNGNEIATGNSCILLGSELGIGRYRLDVTGFTDNRGGSASYIFEVTK